MSVTGAGKVGMAGTFCSSVSKCRSNVRCIDRILQVKHKTYLLEQKPIVGKRQQGLETRQLKTSCCDEMEMREKEREQIDEKKD